MTPPKVSDIGSLAKASEAPPAVLLCADDSPIAGAVLVETMKNRPDYLRTAQGRRQGTGSFLVQARARGDDSSVVRVGFTASKKIGNAVARNRAKRRLRALAQQVLPATARPGWDYVIVAKPLATNARLFAEMRDDLISALQSVHRGAK